ncbi:MAG: agmatinase [Pseudophaeobacter sp. bin_em_oilr2.035]|uniref:Agmatinase n=1 Tax=Phaeobacter gallaeciensis TaxID=60890 RepID=A0ABD4XAH8_9RHOB|nr:agmatinase [Phaeobacter gallaeciensis]MDF1771483.1 agmatinase [Pseudophaeobacter sp. bin_em_oilr2.035]MDE4145450.1 agmatinase [Phaeobacter gallaeciensis]MDE4158121.1 agmatinase [Phaeobacter gallaeciensis]MDE4162300.1 agmatinase [Phaeobacter gallaeciensis]MDE4166526.1 agmatinase [Phaeobacter gallaeciensis]
MTDSFFHPVSGFDVPRFAGVPTFMRLPHLSLDDPRLQDVQVGLIGTPWDSGTTNRPGPRHGPRQLRDMSTMIRAQNGATGVRPFEMVNCADLGDVGPNPADLHDSMDRITQFYDQVVAADVIPLTGGGDHLCSLPILRALGKNDPLGMIHFDSHTDLFKDYFGGTQYTHGTPFRRAIEEGLLDPKRVVQIGIRGTTYDSEDRDFADAVGVRVIAIEEFHARGPEDVMAEAREIAGSQPTYVSYDIDFVDPAFAPGTGTPEVGGPNSFQALQVARLLKGVNIVGADLVEVSPPFDQSGATAFLGVSIMFEILCNLALALGEHSE